MGKITQTSLESDNSKKIPERMGLLIYETPGKPPLVRSIDDYADDKSAMSDLMVQAGNRYGIKNIRLFKVIETNIKTVIDLPSDM